MRNSYQRGTYRGRSPFRTFLKWIILLLAAVLILTVGVVIFIQPYLVYSVDGVKLVLPFFNREPPTPGTTMSTTMPTTVPTTMPTTTIVVLPPEVPKEPDTLRAVLLPITALYDGTAMTRVTEMGGNTALLDMKADSGALNYVSALPLAIQAKSSSGDPAVNPALEALNAQEGLFTVARVSCFKDDRLSDADKTLNILTNSGYQWTDPQKLMWSSPTNPLVRQYVAGICQELAALGFDEILLDNCGYPTQGNLGYIKKGANYDKAELSNVITAFYAQVKVALADYPHVKLSIVTNSATIEKGSDALSGQTVAALAQNADRVWTPLDGGTREQLMTRLTAGGMERANQKLVVIQEGSGAETDHWAQWPSA